MRYSSTNAKQTPMIDQQLALAWLYLASCGDTNYDIDMLLVQLSCSSALVPPIANSAAYITCGRPPAAAAAQVERYNALLVGLRRSCAELVKGIKGLVVMSADLDQVRHCELGNRHEIGVFTCISSTVCWCWAEFVARVCGICCQLLCEQGRAERTQF
jgi:hypothetical protein